MKLISALLLFIWASAGETQFGMEYLPDCKWFGTAPVCNGKCPHGWMLHSTDTQGFGTSCDDNGWGTLLGTLAGGTTELKAHCCKPMRYDCRHGKGGTLVGPVHNINWGLREFMRRAEAFDFDQFYANKKDGTIQEVKSWDGKSTQDADWTKEHYTCRHREFIDEGLREKCSPGCSACGYNWYKKEYNNGNPSRAWNFGDCPCCGGKQDSHINWEVFECRDQCSTDVKPKPGCDSVLNSGDDIYLRIPGRDNQYVEVNGNKDGNGYDLMTNTARIDANARFVIRKWDDSRGCLKSGDDVYFRLWGERWRSEYIEISTKIHGLGYDLNTIWNKGRKPDNAKFSIYRWWDHEHPNADSDNTGCLLDGEDVYITSVVGWREPYWAAVISGGNKGGFLLSTDKSRTAKSIFSIFRWDLEGDCAECAEWACSCQTFSNHFGTKAGGTWGCAEYIQAAWWANKGCDTHPTVEDHPGCPESCDWVPIEESDCPADDGSNLKDCNVVEATEGALCEADKPLPNGNKYFQVDNCGLNFDVFRYTCVHKPSADEQTLLFSIQFPSEDQMRTILALVGLIAGIFLTAKIACSKNSYRKIGDTTSPQQET